MIHFIETPFVVHVSRKADSFAFDDGAGGIFRNLDGRKYTYIDGPSVRANFDSLDDALAHIASAGLFALYEWGTDKVSVGEFATTPDANGIRIARALQSVSTGEYFCGGERRIHNTPYGGGLKVFRSIPDIVAALLINAPEYAGADVVAMNTGPDGYLSREDRPTV